MREAVLSGKSLNNRQAAQGYAHTYFDTAGADLAKLAVYPSDDEMVRASEEAAAECESLIALLGITPGQLYEHVPAVLPGIGSWLPDEGPEPETENEDEEFDNVDLLVISEAEELQALIDAEERPDARMRSARQDREIMSLTCASIAVTVDEHMRVQKLHEPDDELAEEIVGDGYITLQETLASITTPLPPVQLPSEVSKPFGRGPITSFENLDFKALVRLRKEHQTRQAANCARVKHASSEDDSSVAAEESTRRQILRKFHEILKEDQGRGVGTAVEREARWHTDTKPTVGNSANAALAATTLATKVATRRKKLFKDAKLAAQYLTVVENAGMNNFKKLAIGDFGIIWTESGLRVGKVEALYSKGGGKNGKHGAVSEHHNISAFSHIGVQVFELVFARQFRTIPQAASILQTYQFRLLPPFTFLCRLTSKPTVTPVGLELTVDDAGLFKDLSLQIKCLNDAVKKSRSRKKATEPDDDEDIDEDS
ncbi:hypothetical protein DFH07DRAFT_764292 [Mycena maculata]|uniref:Uncharacterized protein n=1 Tax=Mycena maculata TaxID=230809 RepID=A0AAD7P1I2_9AGAR|nr:hypothetical protein DFH07DRAFT_764292 [Mycena maculata]